MRPPDAIGSGIEVVELFGLHLLTRESGGPLSIRHILTGQVRCGSGGPCGSAGRCGVVVWHGPPPCCAVCLASHELFLFVAHALSTALMRLKYAPFAPSPAREVPSEAFKTPNAFIFLPFNNTFLTFYKRADAKVGEVGKGRLWGCCDCL